MSDISHMSTNVYTSVQASRLVHVRTGSPTICVRVASEGVPGRPHVEGSTYIVGVDAPEPTRALSVALAHILRQVRERGQVLTIRHHRCGFVRDWASAYGVRQEPMQVQGCDEVLLCGSDDTQVFECEQECVPWRRV
jgi:hypothetical protein